MICSCKGGELVQRIRNRRQCSEPEARIIIFRLVDAIGMRSCEILCK